MFEPAPRFGPAAKAQRAKEKEEEASRLAKERREAAAASKTVPRVAYVPARRDRMLCGTASNVKRSILASSLLV